MKKLFIICALACGLLTTTYAQNTAYSPKMGAGSDKPAMKMVNEYDGAAMNISGRQISFEGLPHMQKATWAIITDANGEIVKQTKVTPADNIIELQTLRKGMYFVSLVYKNVSKKAFVLNL